MGQVLDFCSKAAAKACITAVARTFSNLKPDKLSTATRARLTELERQRDAAESLWAQSIFDKAPYKASLALHKSLLDIEDEIDLLIAGG